MFFNIISSPFYVFVLLLLLGYVAPDAHAQDDVEVYRVYGWSSFETPERETPGDCRAIDKGKDEPGWAVGRREVADVSDLKLPEKQKSGTAFRVFVDYCVHADGSKERPVGAMTFSVAPLEDLDNIKNWGSRHYRTTAEASRRKPKPGREHFDPPSFKPTR